MNSEQNTNEDTGGGSGLNVGLDDDRLTPSSPERIWLQINAEDFDRSQPYPDDHDGITWCWASIGGAEVDYIRSDLVRAAMPKNWGEDEDWARLAPLLGIVI